jgi:hypoxia-inducible factor (prolyl hydroxylase)
VAVPATTQDATTTATPVNACRLCGTLSTARCGRCRRVYYCSPAHQSSDWTSHKAACARF